MNALINAAAAMRAAVLPSATADKLTVARNTLAELREQHGAVATTGTDKAVEDLEVEIAGVERQIRRLEAASAHEAKALEQKERQQRNAMRQKQAKSIEQYFMARNRAADEFSAAIEKAVAAAAKLIEFSEKAGAVNFGIKTVKLPSWAIVSKDQILPMLANEMWRSSAGGIALPAAEPSLITYRDQPGGEPAINETLKIASDRAFQQITTALKAAE